MECVIAAAWIAVSLSAIVGIEAAALSLILEDSGTVLLIGLTLIGGAL